MLPHGQEEVCAAKQVQARSSLLSQRSLRATVYRERANRSDRRWLTFIGHWLWNSELALTQRNYPPVPRVARFACGMCANFPQVPQEAHSVFLETGSDFEAAPKYATKFTQASSAACRADWSSERVAGPEAVTEAAATAFAPARASLKLASCWLENASSARAVFKSAGPAVGFIGDVELMIGIQPWNSLPYSHFAFQGRRQNVECEVFSWS